ncbi:spinster family MFS transporter [Sphingopyxis terrae]|uniref:spinster family MFS transporter n=1 Tax=Sphingopyxis terrae TaxID=33052 RepID=UPI002A137FC3|nr:MFS transporter [Sphingopyxis terrae]MDX8356512.1 MFS transporter [Sphingopyxis terrae]
MAQAASTNSGKADGPAYWALFVLTMVYALNIADRYVLSTLIEPIRKEFALTDSTLALVTGVGMAIFYVTAGIPLGVLADRVNRKRMIVVALTAWSAMTALCGLSQNFVQLLLARIGVGIGEAGGTPPSQSMLADYFPPEKRALATSIYALGVPVGSAVGGIVAAYVAEAHGWRAALVAAAAMSAPVILLMISLREPTRGRFDAPEDSAGGENSTGLRSTLEFIWARPAARHVMAGATIATFSGMGLIWWTPAFLSRSHGLSVGEAGIEVGMMNGIGGTLALVLSAILMVKLTRHPPQVLAYFLALVTGLITAPAVLAHATTNTGFTLVNLWLLISLAAIYIGPTLALLQNLLPSTMRATGVAILLFTANLANLVIAPQGIGGLSDLLRPHLADPESSLRIALLCCSITGLWAAAHFTLAGLALAAEAREAGGFRA